MLKNLGPLGIGGIVLVLLGIGLIAVSSPIVAVGMVLVLVGLGLVVKALVSGLLQNFGMF